MKKIVCFIAILFITMQVASAATLSDLSLPKNPAYRLGLTYNLEKEYKVTDVSARENEKTASYEKSYIKNSTYADSSLKDLSTEISKLLSIEK